jgi:hypothetical protein
VVKGLSRILVMISAAVVLIALASAASAGGSLIEVSRPAARPGSQIRLSGTFCNGAQAPVTAGPWFAYLNADGSEPILLGRIKISENQGNYCDWRVRATLRVPFTAPGTYWLEVCDRGCTQGVGDLVGAGRFTVLSGAPPGVQARQAQSLRRQLGVSRREQDRQGALLEELEAERRALEARLAGTREDLAKLRGLLASERDEMAASTGVLTTAAIFGIVTAGVVVWRRRRSRVVVPDTPAELLERERERVDR